MFSVTFVRVLNIIGAGLGMALSAVNMFGLFCWFDSLGNKSTWAFRQHCQLNTGAYEYCERKMEFSWAYFHWPKHVFLSEFRNIQFVAYASLVVAGLTQLAVSIHSIFRKL